MTRIAFKAWHIARTMVTPDLVLKTALRIVLGLGVLALAWVAPEPFGHWLHVVGAVVLMFAAWQALGHAEGKFMAHAVSWLNVRRQRWRERGERYAHLAHCRRCGCGSCPYDPANRTEAKP